MSKPNDLELAVLEEALRLRASERVAYLDEACASDVQMRRRVEALLQVYPDSTVFFGKLEQQARLASVVAGEKFGDRIGHYELLEQIGEGGCGVVYLAEQTEPVRRRVALKVIKLGMDTKQVVARFEAERQALALMDHPNIAKVFDGGATETGRPFFVMELVRGVKITDYCDQNQLITPSRLGLFIQVCRAIQHAHQKGVIHRDIKPSNILVTINDGVPTPKVIDFGIAKAIEGRLTDQTLFTALEQFMGTPAYMSPEQAEIGATDIDTRSDIYSLGVLLYELLTGRTPFDVKELLGIGLDVLRRTIREQEPPTPSTRLSSLAREDLARVAGHRQSEPLKLIQLVRGDLDWVVMKALEKDRAGRYETANGLATDVERYIHNEPVTARPPSHRYRFQKLVRRNKLAFTAASAVFAALILGLGASTWSFLQEKEARRQAVSATEEQTRLRVQAVAAREEQARLRQRAETEASRSRQVAHFLEDMLKSVGPSVALGRDTRLLREILDTTARRIGKDLTDQPDVEIKLRITLAQTYHELGLYQQMEEMAGEAVRLGRARPGDENMDVVAALGVLGDASMHRGKLEEAEAFQREALRMKRKLVGNEDPGIATSLDNLADVLVAQGKLAEAESLCREALAIEKKSVGIEHPDVAVSLSNLANVLSHQGRLAEAETCCREALDIRKKSLGSEHPDVAASLNNLASMLYTRGSLAEVETLYRESLAMSRKLLGNEHPEVATTLNNLSYVLRSQGRLPEAETCCREALVIRKKSFGAEHPDVAASVSTLAAVLQDQGKLLEVQQLLREVLTPANESRPQDGGLLRARGNLRARQGRFTEAAADLAKFIQLDPDDAEAWHWLAAILVQAGQFDAYREHCRKCLERFNKTQNPVTAERIAKDCLILPSSGTDLDAICRMAEMALNMGTNLPTIMPWFRFAKGLADYRQGRFDSAVALMQQVLARAGDDLERDAEAWSVMAMARHQLKQVQESRAAWAEADEIANRKLPKLDSGDLGGDWIDRLIAQALLREAGMLINPEDPVAKSLFP